MGKRKGSHFESIVASRYRRGGYKVRKHYITKNRKEIDILARKGKNKPLAIEAKAGKQVITSSVVKAIYEKAKTAKAKPVIVRGPRTKLTKEVHKLSEKLKVKIKALKFNR